ncbi:hypothetical protein [Janibacter sp. G56]|uniref:hypothetical protein n=1 Tax=Janibacter sp. G56 TaxID=3418717 RepID=UPI003CFE8715
MRWERLFDDMESQWAAEARRDQDAEVADRTRAERAGIGLTERLAAHVGEDLEVRTHSGAVVTGTLDDHGDGWLLVGQALVPLEAVACLTGLRPRAGDAAIARRFALGYALRGLSRDRAVVAVTDRSGRTWHGTIDAVGSDALDLSEHAPDEARRRDNVLAARVIPFAALDVIRVVR